jgi:hypothetical protein
MVHWELISKLAFLTGNLLPDAHGRLWGRAGLLAGSGWFTVTILATADEIVDMSSSAGLQQFVDVSFPVSDLNYLLRGLVFEALLQLVELLEPPK